MEIREALRMKKILDNEEILIKHLKENHLIKVEISFHFETTFDQLGSVIFYVPENLGLELAKIIDPDYKPYKICIRVIEDKIDFVKLEGGDICIAHHKQDEKMKRFEEKLKSLQLGIIFKSIPKAE